jgi:hypothetical protein
VTTILAAVLTISPLYGTHSFQEVVKYPEYNMAQRNETTYRSGQYGIAAEVDINTLRISGSIAAGTIGASHLATAYQSGFKSQEPFPLTGTSRSMNLAATEEVGHGIYVGAGISVDRWNYTPNWSNEDYSIPFHVRKTQISPRAIVGTRQIIGRLSVDAQVAVHAAQEAEVDWYDESASYAMGYSLSNLETRQTGIGVSMKVVARVHASKHLDLRVEWQHQRNSMGRDTTYDTPLSFSSRSSTLNVGLGFRF